MSHTKEPWSLKEVANYSGRIKHLVPVDSENMSLLTIVENERAVFSAIYEDEDARRIVACVNACVRMSNEQLELVAEFGGIQKSFDVIEKQRNELLAALERIAAGREMEGQFTHSEAVQRYQKIDRDAVAGATGGEA